LDPYYHVFRDFGSFSFGKTLLFYFNTLYLKNKICHKMQREKLYNLYNATYFIVTLFVLKIDKILKIDVFFSNLNKKSISKFIYRFSQNMVFKQKKLPLVPPVSVNIQYFFCFKGLDESKILSERIFYNWFLGWEKWNLLPFFMLICSPCHQNAHKKWTRLNFKIPFG